MGKGKNSGVNFSNLRNRAEAFINKTSSAVKKVPPQDVKNLVEELHIHQVELEMQNEELRRAQLELEAARDRFSDLYDFAPVGYFTMSNKGLIQEANLTGATMLGVERRNLINRPFSQFITEDTQDVFYLHRQKIIETKTGQSWELRLKKEDGTEFHARLECVVVEDDEGNINSFRAAVSNIDERKQAEEALRESEEKFRSLVGNIPGVSYRCRSDEHWTMEFISDEVKILTGYPASDFLQNAVRSWASIIHPEDKEASEEYALEKINRKEPYTVEFRIIGADGNIRWCYEKGQGVFDEQGKLCFLDGVIVDHTDRKQAEEAIRESEERFRTVADFTYNWEYWIAPDGKYLYVSPSCERITGYTPDEFINVPGLLKKIVHPDDHSDIVDHFQGEEGLEKLHSVDFRIITRSGEERWINHVCQMVYGTTGAYLGRRGSNRDITKQKKMQEELLKAKKLESVGLLAGGIAHDFNNLMSVVVGYISLARMEMKPGSKGFKNLIEAEKASIQTKGLTARLITFSEGGEPVKETVPIGDLVKNSVDSSLKGSDISCIFSVPEDILPVEVDEEQMKQVIHNITTNAQEAMAEQGTINVSCGNVIIGEKDALILKDGKYVKISIEDQGPGIPEEDLIKIFDPYFSTKEMGTQKGMGLGLAVSDSIVKQHDGLITVKSELGTGTILSIYLPASEKEIVEAVPVKKPVPEISVTQGEKILVMDDEEVITELRDGKKIVISYQLFTPLRICFWALHIFISQIIAFCVFPIVWGKPSSA